MTNTSVPAKPGEVIVHGGASGFAQAIAAGRHQFIADEPANFKSPRPRDCVPWTGKPSHCFEAFKVNGGQFHAVEAFIRILPANTPSGWNYEVKKPR